MTNEEAIKLINTMLLAMHLSDPSIAIGGVEEVETALDMAISALEQTNTAEFEECDNPCIECGGNCCPDEDNDGNIHCKCAKVYFRKEPHTNTAEWIIPDLVTGRYKCSHCRGNADRTTRFCPYCGCRMSNYNGKAE